MMLLPVLSLFALVALQAPDSLLPDTPQGWGTERLEFPLSFAPELEFQGFEDLSFAPGMFDPDSDSYFSYALALRLEGDVEIDDAFLVRFLETYYRGLCRAVAEDRKLELDLGAISASIRHEGQSEGEPTRATVAMFDPFVTGEPLVLELELRSHCAPRATELLGLASPRAQDAPIWKELRAIGERWQRARPAAVFLNHVYVVPDQETYDAIAGSSFLRESFAVFEQRETVRADTRYSGLYFYGQRTYFEFLPPGATSELVAGSSGLGLGIEVQGGSDDLARRLAEREVKTQAAPITRQLGNAQVPWFRILGVEMPQASSRFSLFSLEYDPRFLASWHPDLPPARAGSARRDVLERYAAALDRDQWRRDAPFADVTEVQLDLAAAERDRLIEVCAAGGYDIDKSTEEWTCHGPQFRLVLRSSATPGGVTRFELALRHPLEHEPIQLGKAVLSFQGRTATFSLPRQE